MDFGKVNREEEEAMEALYGKAKSLVETPTEEVDLKVETDETPTTTNEGSDIESDSSGSDSNKSRSSWKERFTSYKASTDSTIHELRKTLALKNDLEADLRIEVSNLRKKIRELEVVIQGTVDPMSGVFTKEDEELIGVEAVDIIKKAMKAKPSTNSDAIKRLEAKLEAMEMEKAAALKNELKSFKARSLDELKVKLTKLVPDWEAIDTEAQFAEFIKGVDYHSGIERQRLFSNAVELGDVVAVSRFYKDYQNLKPKSKEEILSSKITPVGGGSGDERREDSKKKTYKVSEYSKFMKEQAMGKWNNRAKEAKILERLYDEAWRDGRLID